MQIDFTVAVPTYNGAKRFPLVLERLRSQLNPNQINWEILIVDNNSNDDTAEVIRALQDQWDSAASLKYVFEPQAGPAFARQRAFEESQAQFIGFLDDDNLPAPDWVASAHAFGLEHPRAGAFGSLIHADYEVEPPQDFKSTERFLVIRKYSDRPTQFEPEKLRLPPGAGLVVRRQAWQESVPSRLNRTQRGGNDYEISLHMHNAGWEIWYNPAMQIYHRIPPWRFEKHYMTAIAHLYGVTTCELLMIITKPRQRPFVLVKSFAGSLRRLVLHVIKYRGKIRTDLDAACEMSFHMGNIISPFQYLKRRLVTRLNPKHNG